MPVPPKISKSDGKDHSGEWSSKYQLEISSEVHAAHSTHATARGHGGR